MLPSKETLVHYKLAQLFMTNISIGQKFLTEFKPNPNQVAVENLIMASTVPEGEWLHILLYGVPRSGKTWGALYYTLKNMLKFPGLRALGIRSTTSELNASVFQDLDKFTNQWDIPVVKRSTHEGLVELGNHSQFWFKSDKSLTPGARENTSRKMGGMEYSIGLVEEADTVSSETTRAIPHRLSQNVGKFRKVIFYTQNPPDTSHWTYEFFFKNALGNPDDPASPIRALHCSLEGNADNIPAAYKAALEKEYQDDPAMHKRFALGIHAPSVKGDPIFKKSFSRAFHVGKDSFWKNWNRGFPLWRGWDFGFRGNALTIMQDDLDRNQLRILRCYLERRILADPFIEMMLAQCYREFPGAEWKDYPDPNGDQHTGLSEHSYHDLMRQRGLDPIFDLRKKSIKLGVNIISKELKATGQAGQARLLIDPGALYAIDCLESGYVNNKMAQKDELSPVKDDTYIHVADSIRYPIVNNRDEDEEEERGHVFKIIRESQQARTNQGLAAPHLEVDQYRGPSRGGSNSRDGHFSRSRFTR